MLERAQPGAGTVLLEGWFWHALSLPSRGADAPAAAVPGDTLELPSVLFSREVPRR